MPGSGMTIRPEFAWATRDDAGRLWAAGANGTSFTVNVLDPSSENEPRLVFSSDSLLGATLTSFGDKDHYLFSPAYDRNEIYLVDLNSSKVEMRTLLGPPRPSFPFTTVGDGKNILVA